MKDNFRVATNKFDEEGSSCEILTSDSLVFKNYSNVFDLHPLQYLSGLLKSEQEEFPGLRQNLMYVVILQNGSHRE